MKHKLGGKGSLIYAGKLPHLAAKTMAPTSRLYNALSDFLRQCDILWQDARHLQTLCWMMIGMIQSQNVHLKGFDVYVVSRAQVAQSHQRRFRRWLSNRRIDVVCAHQALIQQALSQWKHERLYLSLDTTLVWNCFCIVWVGVVYRGRTIPIAWRIVAQSSSTVGLFPIQPVLRQAARVRSEELFLRRLGGGGVSGQNYPYRLANCRAIEQHRRIVSDSTGPATSCTSDARWSGNYPISRPGLCRWQADEVPQGKPGLAFPYPHQGLIPVSDGRAVAQGIVGVIATGASLLHPSGIHW